MSELSFIHRFEHGAQPHARPLLILHGTGGDEDDLIPLGKMVKLLEHGMARFFRRLAEGVSDEEDVRARAHELADFVEAARQQYGIAAPVALGYSNGANITAAVMLLRPEVLAGGILLRAMAPLARPEARGGLAGKWALIVSGARDPFAPPANVARLKAMLERSRVANASITPSRVARNLRPYHRPMRKRLMHISLGSRQKDIIMCEKFSGSMVRVAIAVATGSAVISMPMTRASAQSPGGSGTMPTTSLSLKTAWGEPDLQGIWTDETTTPLQRPARYANQEVFTDAERAELDRVRSEVLGRDRRAERGTERDVSGSYNNVFVSFKRTGARTSLIVDPPNGRIPPLTPEAQKRNGAEREFRLALLQSTETCKNKEAACGGGKYDPTRSLRFNELAPRYNTARMNRNDGPEDSSLAERCLTGGLPEFGGPTGSFRRIVQTPGGVSIFYDVGQGQGWQRNIVMDGRPHLPANIRQWYGDSRGRFDGNTLVIDVTNFSPKTDFQGSRENLHLVERWTRTGPRTLQYVVVIEDPSVWTTAWTVREEFTRQSDEDNRLYTEPRCVEGNYGLPGIIHGRRMEERAFAEGRGPDPATRDAMKDGFIFDDEPLR